MTPAARNRTAAAARVSSWASLDGDQRKAPLAQPAYRQPWGQDVNPQVSPARVC